MICILFASFCFMFARSLLKDKTGFKPGLIIWGPLVYPQWKDLQKIVAYTSPTTNGCGKPAKITLVHINFWLLLSKFYFSTIRSKKINLWKEPVFSYVSSRKKNSIICKLKVGDYNIISPNFKVLYETCSLGGCHFPAQNNFQLWTILGEIL